MAHAGAREIREANIHVKAVRKFLTKLGFDKNQVKKDVVKQTDKTYKTKYAKLNNSEKYTSNWESSYDSVSGNNSAYQSKSLEVSTGTETIMAGHEYYKEQTVYTKFALKFYKGRANSIGIIRTRGAHYVEAGLEVLDGLWRSLTDNDDIIYDMHTINSWNFYNGTYK